MWGGQLFLAQKHMLGNVATHQVMMWCRRKASRSSAFQCPAKFIKYHFKIHVSMQSEVEERDNCQFFPPPLYLLPNLAEEEIVWADKGRGGSRFTTVAYLVTPPYDTVFCC